MDGIVAFLDGARGLSVVKAVVAHGHGIDAIFVPQRRVDDRSIAEARETLGIRVEGVENVNDQAFVAKLKVLSPRIILVGGFSQIMKRSILDVAGEGAINLHAGRLPQYRGGSPLNWQIINGEETAGISVVKVEEGIDAGNVLAAGEVPIDPDDTIADIHEKANRLFPELVLRVLDEMKRGVLVPRPQDESQAAYWHQRNAEDGETRWDRMTARQVYDFVRALTRPYPGAFSHWQGRRLKIFGVSIPRKVVRGTPGRICYVQGVGPYVVCADRAVLLSDYEIEDMPSEKLPHGGRLG